MSLSLSDFGPFGPVVGYGSAIAAAAGALAFLWAGKLEKWRPPEEDLPGAGKSVVLLFCAVGMVTQWYLARPETAPWILGVSIAFAMLCMVCFVMYSGDLGTYVYTMLVATSASTTKSRRILGGVELLPAAAEIQRAEGLTIQQLLEGADFDPDRLWSRESRRRVKTRVLLLFLFTLIVGTWSLTGISFATQVLITHQPAAGVITANQAPGLEHSK